MFCNQHQGTARFPKSLRVKYYSVSTICFSLLLAACQPTTETTNHTPDATPAKPEVIVAQTPATLPPATVGLKRMDFPVYLTGLPSLLHPIIPSVAIKAKSENYDEARKSEASYFQEVAPYEFQSSIYNLVFEELKTGQTHRLFPQDNFVIKAVHTPFVPLGQDNKSAQNKVSLTQKQTLPPTADTVSTQIKASNSLLLGYFIYEVKETPDDEDNKTNLDQQLTLYMSDFNGKNLLKLTPSNQYFKSYKWLPETKRFYFSTQADTNGDRIIDENDKYFYYFIDFGKNPQLVTAYDFTTPKP